MKQNFLSLTLGTIGIALAITLAGCSSASHLWDSLSTPTSSPRAEWLDDGVLVLARPVPAAEEISPSHLLAFMPERERSIGRWVRIDGSGLNLMESSRVIHQLELEQRPTLTPGVYKVILKQETPLWYAPHSYFTSRGLPVPPDGARDRYLRGAFGSRVIYLTGETPIHESPVASKEISGIRLPHDQMQLVFDHLETGGQLEVR